MPVSVSGLVSVDGADNFQERYAPGIGAVVSRTIGAGVALYASPVWVNNTAALLGTDRNTFYMGVGARIRLLKTVYGVAEAAPRLAGFAPGKAAYGFAIEKLLGGHVFQLNFSNSRRNDDWATGARRDSRQHLPGFQHHSEVLLRPLTEVRVEKEKHRAAKYIARSRGPAAVLAACGSNNNPRRRPAAAAGTTGPYRRAAAVERGAAGHQCGFDRKGTATITLNLTRDAAGTITSATADFQVTVSGFPANSTFVGAHIHGGRRSNGSVWSASG